MVIYIYWTETAPHIEAFSSLRKALSARAKAYKRPKRPDILRVTLPDKLTKQDAINLLTQRQYALHMEDIA